MILAFPMILLVLVAYNAVVFSNGIAQLGHVVLSINMTSGALWSLTVSDILITAALFLLFIEVLKATRTGAGTILDHLLSTLVFIACLVEFIIVREAATGTFFLIMVIAFIDVVAGYSVSIRSARRDLAVGYGGQGL
ncbi:MAG: hypothetical protein GY948_17525 [Alphaproteobacteria bacterium]|nr:hypothetical protein [Alphaproteobacteria bacterium]